MATLTYNPREVVELFGETDARDLLRLALSDLRGRLGALRQHLDAGELEFAARAAHSIAGVAGNVMAIPLMERARELETVLRGGRGVPDGLAESIADEAAAVLSAMESFLA
jgi:HPt (histidine-containing phosphotransfer) domain-containing protein